MTLMTKVIHQLQPVARSILQNNDGHPVVVFLPRTAFSCATYGHGNGTLNLSATWRHHVTYVFKNGVYPNIASFESRKL